MSEQKDPNEAAAEQYAAEHGGAFVTWLRDNTVECCGTQCHKRMLAATRATRMRAMHAP